LRNSEISLAFFGNSSHTFRFLNYHILILVLGEDEILKWKRNRQKEYSKKNRRKHKLYVKELETKIEHLEEEVQRLGKFFLSVTYTKTSSTYVCHALL